MWELILLPASVCRWWSTLFLIHVGKSFHETIPFLGDFLQYIRYIPHDHLIHQGIELQQSPRTFEVGWIRWSAERKFDGARSIQDATWLMILEGNPRSTSRIPLISPHLRLALRKYHKSSRWTVEPFIKTRCFGGFLCHRLWKLVGHSGLGFGESRRGFPLNSPLHSPVEDNPSWVFDARVLDEV